MASAAAINLAVYLRSTYDNAEIRAFFESRGYLIVDETVMPDPHRRFSHSICRGKIRKAYLDKSVDKADFVIYAFDGDILDVAGFVTVEFDPEKKSIYIAVICSKEGARGVGTALLTAVDEVAPFLGADRINLDAISEKELTEYYRRRGFEFSSPMRRSTLFPMEKNLSGTRKYNKSLSYNKIMAEEMAEGANSGKVMKYGLFVQYSSSTGNLLRAFSRIEGFINVGYSSSYAGVYGLPTAATDMLKTVKTQADEKKYKISDPDGLVKKLRGVRPDFVFYNYESDPSKPESFALITQESGVFVVSVLLIERRINEFVRTLTSALSKLAPGFDVVFESTAIFASQSTYESNANILDALREDHYKVRDIAPASNFLTIAPYTDPESGLMFRIGGRRRRTRRHRHRLRRG